MHYPVVPVGTLLRDTWPSVERLADVGCPLLVVVGASTEADWFLPLWNYPLAFIRGRVNFHRGSGAKAKGQTRGSVVVCVHREGREGREIARRFVCHFQARAVIVRAPLLPPPGL